MLCPGGPEHAVHARQHTLDKTNSLWIFLPGQCCKRTSQQLNEFLSETEDQEVNGVCEQVNAQMNLSRTSERLCHLF